MTPGIDSLSADQYREQLRAERLLADLDLFEDLAQLSQAEPDTKLRVEFAERYQRMLGVPPENRRSFQNALQALVGGNGKTVQEVICGLAERH